LKNLKRFKKEKKFKTWLFAIAKNACLDFLRKKEKD
jgi:DNA-directed RNA polymerase specialized sigma24 family protein